MTKRPKRQIDGELVPLRETGPLAPAQRRGVWLALGPTEAGEFVVRLPDGAIERIALEADED